MPCVRVQWASRAARRLSSGGHPRRAQGAGQAHPHTDKCAVGGPALLLHLCGAFRGGRGSRAPKSKCLRGCKTPPVTRLAALRQPLHTPACLLVSAFEVSVPVCCACPPMCIRRGRAHSLLVCAHTVRQVLGVALLSGKMHYCADDGGDYLDPYYVLPEGETITKSWCARTCIIPLLHARMHTHTHTYTCTHAQHTRTRSGGSVTCLVCPELLLQRFPGCLVPNVSGLTL